MFLFIFALASVVSAKSIPCLEPDTDYRLPSECPPGQVLDRKVCRYYFLLRTEGKACIVKEGVAFTSLVPPDEVICPLQGETLVCRLYRAYNADCISVVKPYQNLSCEKYDAQGEYENFKICAELTDWIPLEGVKSKYTFYPEIITASHEGLCPTGYCPTNGNKCIVWGKVKSTSLKLLSGGVFETVEKYIKFDHGESGNVTNAANLRSQLGNLQRVPVVRP